MLSVPQTPLYSAPPSRSLCRHLRLQTRQTGRCIRFYERLGPHRHPQVPHLTLQSMSLALFSPTACPPSLLFFGSGPVDARSPRPPTNRQRCSHMASHSAHRGGCQCNCFGPHCGVHGPVRPSRSRLAPTNADIGWTPVPKAICFASDTLSTGPFQCCSLSTGPFWCCPAQPFLALFKKTPPGCKTLLQRLGVVWKEVGVFFVEF